MFLCLFLFTVPTRPSLISAQALHSALDRKRKRKWCSTVTKRSRKAVAEEQERCLVTVDWELASALALCHRVTAQFPEHHFFFFSLCAALTLIRCAHFLSTKNHTYVCTFICVSCRTVLGNMDKKKRKRTHVWTVTTNQRSTCRPLCGGPLRVKELINQRMNCQASDCWSQRPCWQTIIWPFPHLQWWAKNNCSASSAHSLNVGKGKKEMCAALLRSFAAHSSSSLYVCELDDFLFLCRMRPYHQSLRDHTLCAAWAVMGKRPKRQLSLHISFYLSPHIIYIFICLHCVRR